MSQARPGGQGGGHSWRWPRMGRRPVLGGAAAGALGLSAAVGVGAAGDQREPQAGEIKIAVGAIAGVDPSVLGRHMDAAGDLNHARLRDESIEGLLAGFAELLDPEARRQQALRLNERHAEAVPCAPLFATERLNAVHRAVRNHVPHFMGHQHELQPDLWVSA
jgi:hypothetical protein